ncbi:MAG: hypothetical protein K9H25_07770 [Rhodospirillum sp.]|nr:hypothetical protein [Rhodospirillum sp.]MCF8489754.1 hypothetical protein [Rhodospirillum sp.]MCF8502470.1 hypothetical protein [Rhodospirillum sp.]
MTNEMELRALALLHETQMVLNGNPEDLADYAEDLKARLHDLLDSDLAQAMATLSASASTPSFR